MLWILVVGGLVLVGVAVFLYVRHRNRSKSRLIAFVALLREPKPLDAFVIAKTAGRVWEADLGDGNTPGEDGFVIAFGPSCSILNRGEMFLINSFDCPYMKDPEKEVERVVDLRIREPLREHKAWFSCDALGVDRRTSEDDVRSRYQILARLFVEFLDENCLLLYIPDQNNTWVINDHTKAALLADDPIVALNEARLLPVISVDGDDPMLVEAIAKARETWPDFVSAYQSKTGMNHSVKAGICYEGNTEFIWISVDAIELDQVRGRLANEPANLGPLQLDSESLSL